MTIKSNHFDGGAHLTDNGPDGLAALINASLGVVGADLVAVSAADGSDAATTQTLANANKVAVNAVIAALKTSVFKEKAEIAALTPIATANGSDAATTQALANATKTALNAVVAALKA